MGLPDPKKRKPTASEVAAWAKSRIGLRLDIDQRGGAQCWDLPNYIFGRYWGFWTNGNAIHMAWYNYPKGFKFYKNTPDFVPQPGDFAVWGTASFNNGVGHTAVVVGPSDVNNFVSIDQNWYNANSYTGSPAALIKHTYYGISGFVRPAYQQEVSTTPKPTQPTTPKPTQPTTPTRVPNTSPTPNKNTTEQTKPTTKEVKRVAYTDFELTLDKELDYIYHYITEDGTPLDKPKGIYVKECQYLRDVDELYLQRKRFVSTDEYPHAYVDRERVWTPRPTNVEVPEHPGWLVIEVCGAQTEDKRQFMLNQLQAIIYGVWLMSWSKVKLSESTIKADDNIWRSMKDLINYDLIIDGIPDKAKYKEVEKKIIKMYLNRKKLSTETITTTTTKQTIKLKPTKTAKVTKPAQNTTGIVSGVKQKNAKVTVEKSNFTYAQALRLQLLKGYPQISNGVSWYRPSDTQVKNAMNPTTIFNSKTQIYQFLDLGKYQGVPVESLNILLKGKGTLAGQGKAFADGCKKYNLNEIYLIAHALLESGNGTSYFASGSAGVYNYFGIGAYDNNPNNAIQFARGKGWTTPDKAIIGGAQFVRKDYINVGQNTLYRMRWNPKNPGEHQYATDIRWCSHQASTIYSYYKKIGLKGLYFIQDKYS